MKDKKLKAAIMGVLYYLREEEKNESSDKNHWVRSGRKMIMDNQMMVQGRGIRR